MVPAVKVLVSFQLFVIRYILYKTPKTNTLQGVENLYIDPDEMRTAMKAINDPQGVLANTLKPLFKPVDTMVRNKSAAFCFYFLDLIIHLFKIFPYLSPLLKGQQCLILMN